MSTTGPSDTQPTGRPNDRTVPARRSDGPRRVRAGLRLRGRSGELPSSELADRWRELAESVIRPDEREEAMRYARLGQTIALAIEHGRVRASVQGRIVRPYTVELSIGAWDTETWGRVIEAMTREAIHMVKLLAGEVPETVDELLGGLGLRLLPEAGGLHATCTCSRGPGCRHVGAVAYLLVERMVDAPTTLFALRGLAPEILLDRLRQARTIHSRGVALAHAEPVPPGARDEPVPLEDTIGRFWRGRLDRLEDAPHPDHVPHALLRRLGPSPLDGRFPLAGLLASIYDEVAAYARRW